MDWIHERDHSIRLCPCFSNDLIFFWKYPGKLFLYGRKDRIYLRVPSDREAATYFDSLRFEYRMQTGQMTRDVETTQKCSSTTPFWGFQKHRFETNLGVYGVFIKRCLDWSKIWGIKHQHFGFVQCKTSKIKCPSLRNICLPRVSPPHPVVRACNVPKWNLWSKNVKTRDWNILDLLFTDCSFMHDLQVLHPMVFLGGLEPSKSNFWTILTSCKAWNQANSLKPKH